MPAINIIPASLEHLSACKEAYTNSDLGRIYQTPEDLMNAKLTEGINNGEIFVAVDEAGQCLGFAWIDLVGAFSLFPYCKNLAVRKEFRSRGIGTALLNYFEEIAFAKAKRIFIMVSDFNDRAHKLYRKQGYQDVGLVPDLFKVGVSESVLIKFKKEDND